MTSSLLSEGACLDNNHSHFILVDDGTAGKYGGEIPFRASLQNCITTKKIARSEYEKWYSVVFVLLQSFLMACVYYFWDFKLAAEHCFVAVSSSGN